MRVLVSCISSEGEILGATEAEMRVEYGRGRLVLNTVPVRITLSGAVVKFTTYIPDLDASCDHAVEGGPLRVTTGDMAWMTPTDGVLVTFSGK
jgi:hypothetical protein